ncbi:MAG: right-handed parallel beta-helix repeat-containing protein [Prevotella sp.]|nr:right-handed parallel beta-helix repeat-containing protein [Prevotella sp.]
MLSIRRIYTIIAAMLTLCATTMAQTTFSGPIRYVTTSGNYANDGTSWAQAKNNLQDAIESLHDYMTRNGITEGRVYVAKGTYRPTTSTPGGDGVLYTSFLIYDGITVYGGFNATNPEATPEDRIVLAADGKTERTISQAIGLKWRMKNTTTLSGNHSSSTEDPMKWNSSKNEYDESFTGNSYHVVWFATNTSTHSSGLDARNRAVGLANKAAIDGFTIQEGNASNRTVPEETDGRHAYHNSYGGGVYMVANSEVRNCIIRQNASALRGGGVYMDGGGLMEQCYVAQNQSDGVGVTDGYGGGVACDDGGIVRNCIIENNAGRCGGGLSIAFSSIPATDKARYASYASGCVVANNTSQAEAGGVFMRNGGLLNHLTITCNNCVGAGVVYNNRRYGRSGGLYVDGGGMVANSVIWGNMVAANNDVQYATYRESSTTPKVKFDFVALSKYNYVDWSGTVKRTNGVYSLNEENRNTTTKGYYPDFTTPPSDKGVSQAPEVPLSWIPRSSSYLRHQGMQLNDYPTSANYPNGSDYETEGKDVVDAFLVSDMTGKQFAPRCVLGAFVANSPTGEHASVVSVEDNITSIITVFIDPSTDAVVSPSEYDNTPIGNSWDNPFNNINDALDYVKTLTISDTSPVQMLVKEGTSTTAGNTYLPYIRSSFIDLPSHVRLYGGFASSLKGTDISKRNPKAYPTRITANITGSDYAENGCHIITVRHGATDVIVDGFQLYFANAQKSSVLPTLALEGGAGIAIINSEADQPMKDIKIRNCVVANCTASQGSALFLRNTPGAVMQVDVENCIFHNNAVTREQAATVEATGNNTTLTLNHCLIRGNVGYGVMATDNANIKVKNTALHANIGYNSYSGSSNPKITDLIATESNPDPNVVTFYTTSNGKISVSDDATSANNMMDLGVSDAVATAVATSKFSYHSSYTSTYPKFVNPTSNIGVNKDGDVTMYGGDPNWMPMNMNPMVNAANESNPDFGFDFTTVTTRNYGGLSDIGAIENTSLPEFGKVIYVTEKGAGKKDGSSWSNAIAGNTVYDLEGKNILSVSTTSDDYISGVYKETSNGNLDFWDASSGNTITSGKVIIKNNRYERYISGLQYAVEIASANSISEVWVAGGIYTDYKGYVIRDKVNVYGGFPNYGNPGNSERHPLLSSSVPVSISNSGLADQIDKYETILQISSESPVTWDNSAGKYTLKDWVISKVNSKTVERRTVLRQPDVCMPTWSPRNHTSTIPETKNGNYAANTYRYKGAKNGKEDTENYIEYNDVIWDGFTIQNGYITNYFANRDGGAGVRLFRGVTLSNCIVKNNVNVSCRNRAGGIYCDGENTTVNNCFIFNNVAELRGNYNSDNAGNPNDGGFGGGSYMIVGTGFNLLICRNYSSKNGGGLFLECSTFYNNTVAYNISGDGVGGVCHWTNQQYLDAKIELFNCLFYKNSGRAVHSSSPNFFTSPTNCYVHTVKDLDGSVSKKFTTTGENKSYVGTTLANPFYDGDNAMISNNYSLKPSNETLTNDCINTGNNTPNGATLPSTDIDFTDRIQDCTVDIGAYEFNGAYSITPDVTTSADQAVFYVTQNGRGTGSAANPENAACWTKLQKVLDAAGRYLEVHKGDEVKKQVIVKLAGDVPTESVDESGNKTYKYSGFVYRPRRSNKVTASGQEVNTRDYTIIVPHGVEVWGGYSDAFTSSDNNGFYTKVSEGNYTDNRDVLKNRTTLSGVYQADDQDVNVYNVVTFTNDTYTEEGTLKTPDALENISARAVLDGLFIEDGNADGEKQSSGKRTDTRVGGAAIVTGYAHIRNCVVQNNKATDAGGGLYLEEGALVSGSIVQYNEVTKGDGGGLYVEEPASAYSENVNAATNPARIFTSDIIYNTASGAGGGISFTTDGTPNVRANSVLFWQNTGSEQSNVNGMTTPTDAGNTNLTIKDYPISFCATETTREPGINNISVNTDVDKGVRFATETYNHDYTDSKGTPVKRKHNEYEFYKIKKYSLLARGGMEYKDYKALVESDALTAEDMANVTRTFQGNDFIDIGARAIGELVLPVANEDNLMTRIFVVKNEEDVATTSVEVMQNQTTSKYYQQEGSSFAYPMRYLDDALEYVRDARKLKKLNDEQTDSVYAYNDTKFEIILSGGTYYPMRNIKGEYVNSRGRTYLVPEGVTIVGGVETKQSDASSGESYYGNIASVGKLPESNVASTTFTYGTSNVVISHPEIKDIIKNRKLSDINHNNIAEPWEMAVQTILSGQVVNGNSNENVYHVIACIADEKHVGGLPDATIKYHDSKSEKYDSNAGNGTVPYERGVPVIIDGVEIEDGTAMGYDAKAVNSVYTYYKGGAICVEGNWVTNTTTNSGDYFKTYTGIDRPVGHRSIPLEVRNCNFRNNGGCLGGAIFTDSELKVFACNFVQNYAKVETDQIGNNSVTYAGRGGAINASYNTVIVNSLFANNEADTSPSPGGAELRGVGGAVLLGEHASLHMINCDVVRNLAYAYPAIYCYEPNKGGKYSDGEQTLKTNNPHKIVNTIFWGNEVTGGSGMDKVANFDKDSHDNTKNAEMLWFCAYEEGKGNAPVNSKNNIDYRLQDYEGFGTFIPSLWTGNYNKLGSDNKSIENVDGTNPDKDPNTGLNPVTCNIIIDSDNDAINGPNFINPSSKAGKAGYYTSADWMIGRINNLVDNGWTFLQQDLKDGDPKFVYIDDEGNIVSQSTSGAEAAGAGIYRRTAYDYDNVNTGETAVPIGNDKYMTYADGTGKAMLRISTDPNPTHHQTYIDLGVYEYQHVKLDPSVENGHVDVLWVTQQERTSASVADGKTWETATSDVQRAIETLLASRNGHDKEIRMLEGRYQPVYTINGNLGFTITTDVTTGIVPPDWKGSTTKGVNSLTIRGGYSKDVQGLENIHDYPVYLFASERSGVDGNLLGHVFVIGDVRQRESTGYSTDKTVTTDVKDYVVPVYLDGLTFCNIKSMPHTDIAGGSCSGGAAVFYKDQKKNQDGENGSLVGKSYVTENGTTVDSYTQYPISGTESKYPLYKLTMNRCDFRVNGATSEVPAVTIGAGGGEALIYNSVFHSNMGSPLIATDTKVVNCTFALNGGSIQFRNTAQGKSEMHNSVLWCNNGYKTTPECTGLSSGSMTYNAISSLSSDDDDNHNVTLSSDNNDVLQGPNFFAPAALTAADSWAKASRDFRVNPSAKIIGKASPKIYVDLVRDLTGRYPYTTTETKKDDDNDPYYVDLVKKDFDLANNTRYYGSAGMERGAYECIATLSRVLYVNPERVSSSADYNGFSWEKAYTKGNLQKAIDAAAVYSNVHNEKSYVFVKGMATSTGETITMRDNVTLYGSLPSTTAINTGVEETTDKNGNKYYDNDKIEKYIKAMDADRDGMASSYSKHTIVNGVKSVEPLTYCLFDGLEIGSGDNNSANVATSPVVDIQQGNVALRNSIIANNEITATGQPLVNLQSGLLYNTLIRDNKVAETSDALVSLGANGYMLNCTVVGGGLTQGSTVSHAINNIMYKETDAAMPFAPYFRHSTTAYHGEIPAEDVSNRNLWYQLHERTTNIEGGENGDANDESKYDGKSHVSDKLKQYVDYTSDRDLLGNPRFLGLKVDNGCFETWSTGAMTKSGSVAPNVLYADGSADNYNGQYYPHEGSVVYLQPSGKLVCKNITDGAGNVTSHYFTDSNPLRPGYVLALEGGSLYGQGNTIDLRYVAAERTIRQQTIGQQTIAQYSLVSLPFDMNYGTDDKGKMPFVTTTTYDSNNNVTETAVAPFSRYEYDGEARSHYKYSFAESNSTCWKPLTTNIRTANEGMLIDRGSTATEQKLRFTAYGATAADYPYRESADKDYVTLTQYDDRTSIEGGSDFTSVYNMGWNLKGMPYLISSYPIFQQMDDDSYVMNVPHVIYTMNPNGSYVTKQSWASSADNTLSPGEAFFTQTATINTEEHLHFAQLFYTSSASTNTASTRSALNISLSSADATGEDAYRSLGVSPAAGAVCLQPVDNTSDDNTSDDNTSMVYTINRDGAKFMSMNPAIPDIAVCGAGGEMMSLAGAAPVETEISVATRVGTTGRYTFSLDKSAGVSPATTEVWLKDYQTGIVTNLMEDDYTAEITVGENPASPVLTTGRFSLTIGGMRPDIGGWDESGAGWTISINRCHVTVSDLSTDSDVLFYTTDGILRHRATPFLGKCEAELSPGVYVVRAEGNSKVIGLVRRDK